MTRDEAINILECYIYAEKLTTKSPEYTTSDALNAYQRRNANVLYAINTLASIQGWKMRGKVNENERTVSPNNNAKGKT